jgi:hypothetical protein
MIQKRYLYQANRKAALLIIALLTFTSTPWHAKTDTPEEGLPKWSTNRKPKLIFKMPALLRLMNRQAEAERLESRAKKIDEVMRR